jgi:NADPH:quinone reductase-like Zn-dependent oxidoreductase
MTIPTRDQTTAAANGPTQTMRAAVYERYGRPEEVLGVRQVPRPLPDADEVLVRVAAASVQALDWHLLTGTPYAFRPTFGFPHPTRRIPGADMSGTVEAVGADVTLFAPGDEVFAEIPGGGLAEYVVVPERHLVTKPTNIELEDAAAIGVAGLTALQGLRDWGGMKPGDRVLINGASGGVGTFAIQIAKALGGVVTAVCSTGNVEVARSLGADTVIDYKKDDFVTAAGRYDVFFDGVGNRSLGECIEVLNPDGIYVAVSGPKPPWFGPVPRLLAAMVRFRFVSQRLSAFKVAEQSTEDLNSIKDLVEAGKVRPVIDRRFTLAEAPAAFAYFGEGHAKGKVIVTV